MFRKGTREAAPEAPPPRVVRGELPVLLGPVDPGQEAPPLLLRREVQEELDHREPVLGEVALPVVDLPIATAPDSRFPRRLWQLLAAEEFRVDADDQHLLVVRPVEDDD